MNHPNIASIYGFEENALVLELVEGPTLAERIQKGPIPIEEALAIAKQIAEALEAGHEAGVIHRDLKPANIKLKEDGTVKVLDYGLAKALEDEVTAGPESDLSQSPTLTRHGTQMGVILGTAAYMSPEQAKGKRVDSRTDVWAFGAVLYEMLTGEKAFKGEDVSDTLVSVFRDEPDWSKLPHQIPSRILQAIRVCLQKDPKERVRDIAAVRLAMAGAFEAESPFSVVETAKSRRRGLPAFLAAGLALIIGSVFWGVTRPPPAVRNVSRTSIVLPRTHVVERIGRRRGVAISPSGTRIAYVTNRQLYLRAMDELDAEPLGGTEASRPVTPFFSPDGQWVGFYSGRDAQLQKVAITGGAAVSLCPASSPFGASWSGDETIVFGQGAAGIFQVSAAGGAPEVLVAVEKGESASGPQILPDGRSLLFTLGRDLEGWNQIVVQSLDTGERRVLIEGGSNARYLDSGHLVYALAGELLAVPFDLAGLEVVGVPVSVVGNVHYPERVGVAGFAGAANFDVSRDGSLVYRLSDRDTARTLLWVDRDGREEPIATAPGRYNGPRISPDGTKMVFKDTDGENDLWVWDFARETRTRLTFGRAAVAHPVWMPDNQSVVYASNPDGDLDLYRKAVDGTGDAELLSKRANDQFPMTVTPDGARLVFHEFDADRRSINVAVMNLDGERAVESLLDTDYFFTNGNLSPDGRWLAFGSNASGEFEIYVRPFPDVDSGQWQISSGGGRTALWGPSGDELFFWYPGGGLMRVAIDTAAGFRPEIPERIIESGSYYFSWMSRTFDISPDGERFLMTKEAAGDDDGYAGLTRFILVQNWFEELKRLVPTDN